MWDKFKKLMPKIKVAQLYQSQKYIRTAAEWLEELHKSKFFNAYYCFFDDYSEFHENYAYTTDKDDIRMRKSAETYFSNLFETDSDCLKVKVDVVKKEVRGVQVSLMKCVFGLNLNIIIKTFIGWLYLCGHHNKNGQIRRG